MSHTITWEISARYDGLVTGTAVCHGGDLDDCRREFGSETYDHCLAVEWWDHEGEGLQYYYRGPDGPLRDGPVDVEWTGDVWVWDYAEVAR